MRILPDSRDLINLTENGRPVATDAFRDYLLAHDHEIVLTFTNVRELCGPLAEGADFLQIRGLLQSLEAMAHTYVQELAIIKSEIEAALEAFNEGEECQPISPYVTRWDQTLARIPGQEHATEDYVVGLRLDDIVYLLSTARPDVFSPPARHLPRLVQQFEEDRHRLRAGEARPRQHFVNAFHRHAARRNIALPNNRENDFVEWVYANPNRCPGVRLHHETYRELMLNVANVPEVGDFSDLSHIYVIPYVDAATLDRRMRTYCFQASRRIARLCPGVDYRDRLYHDLCDLMEHHQ